MENKGEIERQLTEALEEIVSSFVLLFYYCYFVTSIYYIKHNRKKNQQIYKIN